MSVQEKIASALAELTRTIEASSGSRDDYTTRWNIARQAMLHAGFDSGLVHKVLKQLDRKRRIRVREELERRNSL